MTKQQVKQAIANKIEHRLVEIGWQKKDLANALGVQPSSVTRWISGKHNFTLCTLFGIERALCIRIVNLDTPLKQDQ